MAQTTVGGVTYQATPGHIKHVGDECMRTADEISGQLAQLKSYVMDLEARWKGIAAQQFSALMTDFDIYGSMLHQALTGIGEGLYGTWRNYSDSEEQNIASLQTVNGSLPGAPGATIS
jgi:WXG100 family type VII secretion target